MTKTTTFPQIPIWPQHYNIKSFYKHFPEVKNSKQHLVNQVSES